jgi:hypothetical protein
VTLDTAAGSIAVTVLGSLPTEGLAVKVTAAAAGEVVGAGHGLVGLPIHVNITNPQYWTPDDPFLYDLEVTLAGASRVVSHPFVITTLWDCDSRGCGKVKLSELAPHHQNHHMAHMVKGSKGVFQHGCRWAWDSRGY